MAFCSCTSSHSRSRPVSRLIAIIERLNSLVKTKDILYFLGDFCIGPKQGLWSYLASRVALDPDTKSPKSCGYDKYRNRSRFQTHSLPFDSVRASIATYRFPSTVSWRSVRRDWRGRAPMPDAVPAPRALCPALRGR
jgi:hypothetical protein